MSSFCNNTTALAVRLCTVAALCLAPQALAFEDTGAVPGSAPAASTAAAPAMPGLAAQAGENDVLGPVYAARGHAPVWGDAEGGEALPRAHALVAALRGAGRHALPVSRYEPERLAAALAEPWSARSEMAFSEAFLRYARDVSSGLLEPRRIDRDINVRPRRPDGGAVLEAMAATAAPEAFLEALAPGDPDYRRMKALYAELTALAEAPDAWGLAVPKGATLRVGDRDPRVVALRSRLAAMGDLGAVTGTADSGTPLMVAVNAVGSDAPEVSGLEDARVFDDRLERAVRHFQARHGLNTDGIVGPATLAALNASPAFRAKQVAVNLERARWNNGRIVGDRIVVNLPDFHVEMIEDERVVFESRVVIGRERHQTVEFSDVMDHMVVNPTWFVPMSIATKEILPKLQADPTYLDRNNMRLVGSELETWAIDWTTVTPATFPGRVRQAPGDENALGRVKFMFPNDFAIYLHDTPQRSLFRRDIRAYSHGCVRVEKPLEFAEMLLRHQEADPAGAFSRWLDTGRERYVKLERKVPVHIIYRTTWIDPDGQVQFRGDVYDRDRKVARAMAAAGVEIAGF